MQKKVKQFLILGILAAIFILPGRASAAVIYEQSNNFAISSSTIGLGFTPVSNLGTGISGTASQLIIQVSSLGDFASATQQTEGPLYLYSCPVSFSTLGCPAGGSNPISGMTASTTLSSYPDVVFDLAGFTFNPSYYYAVQFGTSHYGFHTYGAFGIACNLFQNGINGGPTPTEECNENGIQDFFLVIDSTYDPLPPPPGPIINLTTHFISTTPSEQSTTSTTTAIGADVYINNADMPNGGRLQITLTQPSAAACQNKVFTYAAALFGVDCSGPGVFQGSIKLELPSATSTALITGEYPLYATTTLPAGGKWHAFAEIQSYSPGFIFGIGGGYTTVVSTTTEFIVGAQSTADLFEDSVASSSAAQTAAANNGIGSILASTTAQLTSACDIIGGSFSLGDCLTLAILPDSSSIGDDILTIERLPPWGYVFRFIDILNAPVATSTLPSISYSFSSTSPLAAVGTISFDPFGLIASSSSFISSAVSDTTGAPDNVWQIMNPVVTIVVYLALFYEIMFELLHIDWGGEGGNKKHFKSDQ
jgi:hypothetical protein